MMRLLAPAALAILAALALAGFAAFGVPGRAPLSLDAAPVSVAQAQTVEVKLGEYYFDPKELQAPIGPVVFQLSNVGPERPHTFAVRNLNGQGELVKSPQLRVGTNATLEATFTEPGTYQVYCTLPGHADRGQVGTLTVSAAAAAGSAQPPAGSVATPTSGDATLPPPGRVTPQPDSESSLVQFSLWVHIPAVTLWIGLVMLDLFIALVPGVALSQRGQWLQWSGWITLVLLLLFMVTGIYQTVDNPVGPRVTNWDTLQELKTKEYGFALFVKHIFVVATIVLTLGIRFIIAPRMSASRDASSVNVTLGGGAVATMANARTVAWLSAINLIACMGALFETARMVFTLH